MLAEVITDDVFYVGQQSVEEREDHVRGCQKIAEELVQFARDASDSDLILVNDTTDDIEIVKSLEYRCVGSRYRNDEELQNEHLTNGEYAEWPCSDVSRREFFRTVQAPEVTDNS